MNCMALYAFVLSTFECLNTVLGIGYLSEESAQYPWSQVFILVRTKMKFKTVREITALKSIYKIN
jgi:hypothetical protein